MAAAGLEPAVPSPPIGDHETSPGTHRHTNSAIAFGFTVRPLKVALLAFQMRRLVSTHLAIPSKIQRCLSLRVWVRRSLNRVCQSKTVTTLDRTVYDVRFSISREISCTVPMSSRKLAASNRKNCEWRANRYGCSAAYGIGDRLRHARVKRSLRCCKPANPLLVSYFTRSWPIRCADQTRCCDGGPHSGAKCGNC